MNSNVREKIRGATRKEGSITRTAGGEGSPVIRIKASVLGRLVRSPPSLPESRMISPQHGLVPPRPSAPPTASFHPNKPFPLSLVRRMGYLPYGMKMTRSSGSSLASERGTGLTRRGKNFSTDVERRDVPPRL